MNNFYSRGRLIFFAVITGLLIFGILFSYANLMFKPEAQVLPKTMIRERGSILDRNGKVLAIQTTVYNLSVTPSAIKKENIPVLAAALGPIIGIEPAQIEQQIKEAPSDFLYLKKRINQSEHDDIQAVVAANNLRGLRLEKAIARSYPENSLAAQLIGFMGNDGKGLAGIEYSFQNELAPPDDPTKINTYGNSIMLTIDAGLQYKLEQLAKESMERTQAESMMLIAAEAKTGEILSYISYPAPNLNTYGSATAEEKKDRPAKFMYEPGSVFKIFSVASFIDAGVISENDVFVCDGVFEVKTTNGELVRIKCLDHHGPLTARQALQYSCNDAIAQMSQKIRSEFFLEQIHKFGFGSKTGIELPSEEKGLVKDTTDSSWSGRSKPTIAMGQEISVTALQMVQAASAIANGGKPVQLSVVSKILNKDDKVIYQHVPEFKKQVIKKSTADYVLSCMETTARIGTGAKANVGDIAIGVKTGTAQMADTENGGYSDKDFLSSCMAIFPIENPEIILYIVITKAKGETYGGRIVAPVIQDAANTIIDYLGMQRDRAISVTHSGKITIPQTKPIVIKSYVPDFTGYPKRMLTPLLNRTDIKFVIKGDGWVVSQNPEPGTPVTENMIIELTLE
ncbi:MAG: transpeptidase family protein [Spirochaetaceae bacterium]|nr:transpeptidase family protein [Spirochaetaceae bacterium]